MPEPALAPIPCPFNGAGWPMAMFRVELTMAGSHSLDLAAFTVASVSRAIRLGVVATFNGADLYAFPHQSVDEVVRTYLRERLTINGADVSARAIASQPIQSVEGR